MAVDREMPRYVCHKQVWALKIASVQEGTRNDAVLLTFHDDGYAPVHVDFDWYYRHKPEAGGYYVVYKDGYKSYSPAKAFEDGYALEGAAPAAQAAPQPAAQAAPAVPQWPRVFGVSRDIHPRCLVISLAAEPTDDQVRAIHAALTTQGESHVD